jgi:LysM repeat protein
MPTPPADLVDQNTPSGPISPDLAPPAEPAPAPSLALDSGPVHMPPAEASAPVHEHQQIYVVKITDSYKKIAHAHHITVAELKEANHIKGSVLHTGQKLVIPSDKTLVATTTALDSSSTGPVLSESAAPMTTSLVSAPSTEAATVPYAHVYTVVKGDTLIKIAHKFKTTANALMAENSISDPTKLAIGKKLRIPSEESRSARNSAPSSTQPSQVQAKENAPSAQLANFVP